MARKRRDAVGSDPLEGLDPEGLESLLGDAGPRSGSRKGRSRAKRKKAVPSASPAPAGGERTLEQLQEDQVERPDDVDVKIRIGRAHARNRAYPEAQAALEKAVRLDPRSAEAQEELGIVLCKKGLYEPATQALEHALALDGSRTRAHYYLGVCHNQLDRLDRAAEAFERAVRVAPGDDRAWYQLGVVYDRQGRGDEAREMYRRARQVKEESR